MLLRLYQKYFAGRFMVKLICIYSLIIIASLVITGTMVINKFYNSLLMEGIENQKKVTEKMVKFTEKEYSVANTIMLQLYVKNSNDETIAELLAGAGKQEPGVINAARNKINSYLEGICKANSDIVDIMLFNEADNTYFYHSSIQNRAFSPSYNFKSNRILEFVRENDISIKAFSDVDPQYIIGSNNPVITLAGNIYDLSRFPEKSQTGKFIINLSTNAFQKAYKEYSYNDRGELLITNDDGYVLLDTANKYTGSIYPYFNDIIKSDVIEMTLGEPSIVNWHKLKLSNIHIIDIIPKDEISQGLIALKNQTVLFIIVGIIFALLVTISVSNFFTSRMKELTKAMHKVDIYRARSYSAGLLGGFNCYKKTDERAGD